MVGIAYYFDESVNRAIALGLRLKGVEILTVPEDGKSGVDDLQVLSRTIDLNRPLVTADQDFLEIAHQRLILNQSFPGIIFLRPHISIGYVIENLLIYAELGELSDFMNQVIFL